MSRDFSIWLIRLTTRVEETRISAARVWSHPFPRCNTFAPLPLPGPESSQAPPHSLLQSLWTKGQEPTYSKHDPQLMPLQTLLVQIGIIRDYAISPLYIRIVIDPLLTSNQSATCTLWKPTQSKLLLEGRVSNSQNTAFAPSSPDETAPPKRNSSPARSPQPF